MAGKNDILATAGVDLSAFEAGIAKLTSRLDAVEKAGSKAADGIAKVDKSASALKNIQVFDHLGAALSSVASKGGQAATALGSMDMSVARNQFDDLGAGAFGLGNSLGRGIDFMAKMPGKMGAVGAGLQALTDIAQQATVANDNFADEMVRSASTTEGMIQKSARLANLQVDELNRFKTDKDRLESLGTARDRVAKDYEKQANKQIALEKDLSAGGKQRLGIALAEAKAEQAKADLKSGQTVKGVVSEAGKKIIESGSAEIDAKLELEKKSLWFSEQQEASSAKLNELASVRGIKIQDQFSSLKAQSTELEKQLALAKKLYGENSAIYLAIKAQQNALVNSGDELAFNVAQQNKAAEMQTESMLAHIAGNKKLAALAENRAKFENQIRDAQKAGLIEVAQALKMQQNLNELEIKAQEILKTPQQKKQERDEQKKHDKAIRDAAGRITQEEKKNAPRESELDKFADQTARKKIGRTLDEMEKKKRAGTEGFDKLGNPLPQGSVGKIHGEKKTEDYKSKETEKIVKDFADRHKLVRPENVGVKGMNDFIAQNLTINGVFRNAP